MRESVQFSESEKYFQCPICQKALTLDQKSLYCENNHCFDIAKAGYVNLLMGNKHSKHYDKESFQNRREILESGYYAHILQELVNILNEMNQEESIESILDVGCGEGYYSREIKQLFNELDIMAFDISKDSVQLAAKSDKDKSIKWFVGNLEDLPIKNHTIDVILDIYTPANYAEFNRVLTKNGYIIKVIPGNDHLKEFREIAENQLQTENYSNKKVADYFSERYSVVHQQQVSKTYSMSQEEIRTFAEMTPLLFNVDKNKIDFSNMHELTISGEVLVGKL